MRRRVRCAAVGLALVLCAPAAAATPRDAASTHVFLTAAARLLHVTIAHRKQEAASANAVIAHVDSACPHAIPATVRTGTPGQQTTAQVFAIASEGEIILAEIRPLRAAYSSFSHAVAHLQWSEQRLNRQVAVAVRQALAVARIGRIDLCREAGLARASNFQQAPPGLRAFVRRFVAATSSPSPTVTELEQLMKPLAGPGDAGLIEQVHQLQVRVNRSITHLTLGAVPKLVRALFG